MQLNFGIDSAYVNDGCSGHQLTPVSRKQHNPALEHTAVGRLPLQDRCSNPAPSTAESLLPILIRIRKHAPARLIVSSHQSLGSSPAMRRRDVLLFGGAMAIAWKPATAEAEITRIGFIQPGSRQENQRLLDTFGRSLSALGWTDGKDITILARWADDRTEALPAITKELIGSGVAVLITAGTPATVAAKRASASLPIVLVAVDDPVSLGIVESLGQPGGNATGLCLTSSEVITERLELLRELVPGLHRLAVIVRSDPGLDQKLRDIRSEARVKGIEPLMLEAPTGKALELAFARLRGEGSEAIYVASGPLGPAKRTQIIALAAESGLPAIYSFRIFPAEGGLISFAADYDDLFRRAAGFVDRILRGAKPAAMPVEPPRKFKLTVNLNTAKALGLTIPPTILAGADEVIQ